MLVKSARIEMTWEDGRTVTLGTVGIDENGKPAARCKHMRQRIGWELVRMGFMCMLHGRKWRMKVGEPDATVQALREDHTGGETV